jgi:hypothetical protein
MTPLYYFVWFGLAFLLLASLLWALRRSPSPRKTKAPLEEQHRSNIQYFAQVQQALSAEDREYLLRKGPAGLAQSVDRERRKVALDFLEALDEEFSRLLRLAKVIATLSPEVAPLQEFERMRLSVVFHWRLQAIRALVAFGMARPPKLAAVSDIISQVSVRMESAMKALGERAALAAEMASAVDRSDVHLA